MMRLQNYFLTSRLIQIQSVECFDTSYLYCRSDNWTHDSSAKLNAIELLKGIQQDLRAARALIIYYERKRRGLQCPNQSCRQRLRIQVMASRLTITSPNVNDRFCIPAPSSICTTGEVIKATRQDPSPCLLCGETSGRWGFKGSVNTHLSPIKMMRLYLAKLILGRVKPHIKICKDVKLLFVRKRSRSDV